MLLYFHNLKLTSELKFRAIEIISEVSLKFSLILYFDTTHHLGKVKTEKRQQVDSSQTKSEMFDCRIENSVTKERSSMQFQIICNK